jgi:uncharacterized protein YndB with AHSA1/START domain
MMGAFIYLAPLLVGMVTVYLAERQRRRSWGYYLWAPALANVIFVAGTLVILIEGIICAVLIVPLFAVLGAVGGIVMGAICRLTRWPKHAVYCFATLPIILGSLESRFALPDRVETIERRILIDAPPETVWEQIWNVAPIRPEEVDRGWMYRIGVPLPIAANTKQTPDGLVRRITMGKGIHFDQVVTDWEPNRYVHWTYRFDKDSFPPAALDDHVMIGGYYFDLRTTSYTLVPQGERTQLTIRMEYRVTTPFNWYAEPIAKFLVGNFEEVVLNFYRNRSQAQSVTTAVAL